jgi:hypothetical protein
MILSSFFRKDEAKSWTQQQMGFAFIFAATLQGLINNHPFGN